MKIFPFLRVRRFCSYAILPRFKTEQSSNDYITSLCKQRFFKEALEAFDFSLKGLNCCIWPSTYAHLFSACSSLRSLEYGRRIHNDILTRNFQPDLILFNHILNMYGKCGASKDAQIVFDKMPEKNVVSWTSLIAGCTQNNHENDAIRLYLRMLRLGLLPDQFTFGSIIRACTGLSNLELGRQLHSHVVKSEFGSHLIAQNALITMYTRVGQITDALHVFAHIKAKDLISWSSIIAGFTQLGYDIEALRYFKEMLVQGGYHCNEFIFGSAFSACGSLLQPEFGQQIHGMSIKFGLGKDAFAGCSLTDMYSKCGLLHSARAAFFQIEGCDIVCWNSIIAGFAYVGEVGEAVLFYTQMRHLGLSPDDVTVRSLLCACTSPFNLCLGMQVHCCIIKIGLDFVIPVCNTLLSMYARCSSIFDACKMFNEIKPSADLVSWNTILTIWMQQKQVGEVFKLFKMMLLSPNEPDHITLTTVLGACGEMTSLQMGDQIHCYAAKIGHMVDTSVVNGFIDMYTKCGALESARELFNYMENPDVISWSSLIVGYAQSGHGRHALDSFKKMRSLHHKPNEVTLVGVLTACSHLGLVEEGWNLFRTMEMDHGIRPTREHCACIVDLLARAGRIYEAEAFINQMTFEPGVVIWKTLLAACKTQNNVIIGKRAAENILKIDPSNSAAHVLLCNIYASRGNWNNVATLRRLMKENGVKKVPGQSWIEIMDTINVFVADDNLHPESDKIYTVLEELWLQMLDTGLAPIHKITAVNELLCV